jgi:hypothetical protein
MPYPFYTGLEIEVEKNNNYDTYNANNMLVVCNKLNVKITSDGSLTNGIEFITPPLYSNELNNCIRELTRALQENNLYIKSTCGLHVHVNAREWSQEKIKRIARFYMVFEHILFDMLPNSRLYSTYCVPLDKFFSSDKLKIEHNNKLDYLVYQTDDDSALRSYKSSKYCNKRYSSLNLHSYFFRGTIEFRLHSGTMNYHKIKNWVNILHSIINATDNYTDTETDKLFLLTKEKRLKVFKKIIGNDLYSYYQKRVAKFSHDTDDNEVYQGITNEELELLF